MRQLSLRDRCLSEWRGRLVVAAALAVAGGAMSMQFGPAASASAAADQTPFHTTAAPVRLARQPLAQFIWMEVTAYCPCKVCCGRRANGVTASGKSVRHNGGRFVAADTAVLPFGTHVSVPGYHDGKAVPVIDTGGAITGHHLDVFFRSHATAEEWGRKMLRVRVDRAN